MNPRTITYHRESRTLELDYIDDTAALLPAELLRVFSPSAEVRGHSEDERVLQTGKKYVEIKALKAVGNYAIRIVFDDGHDTGIYSWGFLHDLAARQDEHWQNYLTELKVANASRLPTVPIGHWAPPRDDEPS
jgi:DUF971 family protein